MFLLKNKKGLNMLKSYYKQRHMGYNDVL